MLVGGRQTKILESMRKACVNAIIVGGLDSAIQTSKLVNEQTECNANVQTMKKVLKATGFEA